MADHLDAFDPTTPGLDPPGGDPSIDITDIYAFKKKDADKSILILNVNPLSLAPSFNDDALYELKVDTDGDARADIAFRFRFSAPASSQDVTVRRATGKDARKFKDEGEIIITGTTGAVAKSGQFKLFAGLRSDPFFFDLGWFLAGLPLPPPGVDFFINLNVFGIVLEVPNSALGPNPDIGVWGVTSLPKDGGDHFEQIERMGRPAINTVFMSGAKKNEFNRTEPHKDTEKFTDEVVGVLTTLGGALGGTSYTAAAAAGIAAILLPDILTYNYSNSAGFLNGRRLEDDVIDIELGLVTNTARTTDNVGAHTDLRKAFPFLGKPH